MFKKIAIAFAMIFTVSVQVSVQAETVGYEVTFCDADKRSSCVTTTVPRQSFLGDMGTSMMLGAESREAKIVREAEKILDMEQLARAIHDQGMVIVERNENTWYLREN